LGGCAVDRWPDDVAVPSFGASLNRPGGNVTGVNFFLAETRTKLLGLLHDLVPTATTIGLVLGIGSNTQNVDVTDLPAGPA
jgi:ABC-type uncharacterized transport system substrate-binding protein